MTKFIRLKYWQTEASLSELNQKIVSHNLLCLQLKDGQFGRSWVRISRESSILQHQNKSDISQVGLFIQPCHIHSFKVLYSVIITRNKARKCFGYDRIQTHDLQIWFVCSPNSDFSCCFRLKSRRWSEQDDFQNTAHLSNRCSELRRLPCSMLWNLYFYFFLELGPKFELERVNFSRYFVLFHLTIFFALGKLKLYYLVLCRKTLTGPI